MNDNDKKICEHCGKRGGRVRIDPWDAEINDKQTKMRLHEECAQERADDV